MSQKKIYIKTLLKITLFRIYLVYIYAKIHIKREQNETLQSPK